MKCISCGGEDIRGIVYGIEHVQGIIKDGGKREYICGDCWDMVKGNLGNLMIKRGAIEGEQRRRDERRISTTEAI